MPQFYPMSGGSIGSALMPTFTPPSADEQAIYMAPSLIDWWRADTSVRGSGSTFKWRGRKQYKPLTPLSGTGSPSVVASAYASRTALVAGTGANAIGDLGDGGANLMPVNGSFSLVWVGRRGSVTAILLGTDSTFPTYIYHRGTDDRIQVFQGGVSMGRSAGSVPFGTAPHIGIYSYDYATKAAKLRLNRADAFTKTGILNENLNPRFQVFASGDGGTTASGAAQMFEAMVFNTAIHLNATLLAHVETYLHDRYGLG